MEVYFAYGSNMSSERLRARVPRARPIGRARIPGWRLAFNKPGRDGTGKANLVADRSEISWGVLYEIPTAAWAVLDRFEPLYEHASFRVATTSGSLLDARGYVFPCAAETPSIAPSARYLDLVIAGAREHGLPEGYIERIRAFGG